MRPCAEGMSVRSCGIYGPIHPLYPPRSCQLSGQLVPAIDKIIKRKVEDFELDYVEEGGGMNATTNNTVNIIGSNISNSVMKITQSGKDTISKDTAQALEQLGRVLINAGTDRMSAFGATADMGRRIVPTISPLLTPLGHESPLFAAMHGAIISS